MSIPTNLKRTVALACATVLMVIGLGGTAHAFGGGETGYLLIHGPGSVYAAGHNSINNQTTTAGGTATFAFEIKNTGSATAQFNFHVTDSVLSCTGTCTPPTLVVTTGSIIATTLAQGANGYYSPPIAPGKTALFSLKATVPKGANAGSDFFQALQLYDTSGTYLDGTFAVETVTSSKGTAANDEYVTGAGSQKPVGVTPDGSLGYVTDPTAAPAAKSVYTVKLQNDTSLPAQISYHLIDASGCASEFPATVKVGSTDVTAAALSGSYLSPVLAPAKSVTLTVTVVYAGALSLCGQPDSLWNSESHVGSNFQDVYLVTNASAS